ncbi:hypothetical protein RJT34_01894 [Clitoria ternatea]|uniref:Uncharacterized protein n=1 Tax=Clitoria ternatea TaxID=43366 RepID=A0AAN9Q3K5_CLITE
MDMEFLRLHPLAEPLQHPPRSPALEYIPLSPRGDNNEQDSKDTDEHPLEGPRSNPTDILMADPTILPNLPKQIISSEPMDLAAALTPVPVLPVEPLGIYIPKMMMESLIHLAM